MCGGGVVTSSAARLPNSMTNISSVSLVRPARVSGGPRATCSSPRRVASRRFQPRCAVFGRCHIACNQQRFGGLRRGVSNTRLTDALLQLRPFVPPKDSVGPDALGVPGPCFAARETSENLQMIFQRRKRLAFAPAAFQMYVSAIVSNASSALALERRLRCDPSHTGVMAWPGGVMATPTFCHALSIGATFASPGFACPLLWRRGDILARTRPLSN
jgi:hypothetical protein